MKKKVLSVLMAAAMTVGLLAGCGGGNDSSSESGGNGAAAPAADRTEDESAPAQASAEGWASADSAADGEYREATFITLVDK